jgi:hypothetical protein
VKRKPSDALVTTVLRAHFRKLYGEHKSVSVGGGVLVVGGAQEMAPARAIDHREPKRPEYLEMTPIEASEEEEARRGGFMVVGQRAKTSAEIEEREREYLSKTIVIEFVESEGDGQRAAATGDNGPPNPNCSEGPVAAGAHTAGARGGALAAPSEHRPAATAPTPNRSSGIGYGKSPTGGFKVC